MLSQFPPDLWMLLLLRLAMTGDSAAFRDLLAVDAVAHDFRIPLEFWNDCIRKRVLMLTSGLKIGSRTSWDNMFIVQLTVDGTPEANHRRVASAHYRRIAGCFMPLLKDYLMDYINQPATKRELKHMVLPCPIHMSDRNVYGKTGCGGHSAGSLQRRYYECMKCDKQWSENLPGPLIRINLERSLALHCSYGEFVGRGLLFDDPALPRIEQQDTTQPIGRRIAYKKQYH